VPRIAALAGAGILERLELKSAFVQANRPSISKKAPSVGGHEVRHLLPLPDVTVKPEATVHCVDHPIATFRELYILNSAFRCVHAGK
jgi:hypothetical protein